MFKASDVKELREKTGAGMLDCKKALEAVEGDMEKAIDWLREKGISKAAKKEGRIAAEGIVATYVTEDSKIGVVVEVNAETDFVAKNEEFKELTAGLAEVVAATNPADVDALLNSTCEKCGKVISEVIKEKIASIGEKITFRRFVRYEGATASYVHNGKIGVLVQADKKDDENVTESTLPSGQVTTADAKIKDSDAINYIKNYYTVIAPVLQIFSLRRPLPPIPRRTMCFFVTGLTII